jgi:hypothetical protein
MSTKAESNISELSNSSFSKKPLLWYAVLATAVLTAIFALIAAQSQPGAIDDLGGIALPF